MKQLLIFCCLLLFAGAFVSSIHSASVPPSSCPVYPPPVPLERNSSLFDNLFEEVDQFLAQQQVSLQFPGLFCSVVFDQELFWSKGYGKIDPFNSSSTPPTLDSIVRIASITKVFTDMMLMLLRDAGSVTLDDAVTEYLPMFRVRNPYNTNRPITLRQLGSHTSGLQSDIPVDFYLLYNYTQEEILQSVAKTFLLFPQYTHPHYSNLGVALLGRALEAPAGISFEDFVESKILQPLGMNSTTFDFNSFVKEHMAIGVIENATGIFPAPLIPLGWGNPMGGLWSSARDMSRFLSFFFRDNQTQSGAQLLDSATVNEFLLPVIFMNDGAYAFGQPWEDFYTSSHWLRSKGGGIPGYRSQIAMVPELKLGVFCYGTTGHDDSTTSMLTVPLMNILIPVFTQALWANQPDYILPSNASAYTGLFQYDGPQPDISLMEVYIDPKTNVLISASTDGISAIGRFNLTQLDSDANVFSAQKIDNDECDFANKGGEFFYFDLKPGGGLSVTYSAKTYQLISKNCPQC